MLFLLALKWNFQEEAFSNAKTKTNPNFVIKLANKAPYYILINHQSIREDPNFNKPNEIESIFTEIIETKTKNTVIGWIYKHPKFQ